jgi:hypothetical protein
MSSSLLLSVLLHILSWQSLVQGSRQFFMLQEWQAIYETSVPGFMDPRENVPLVTVTKMNKETGQVKEMLFLPNEMFERVFDHVILPYLNTRSKSIISGRNVFGSLFVYFDQPQQLREAIDAIKESLCACIKGPELRGGRLGGAVRMSRQQLCGRLIDLYDHAMHHPFSLAHEYLHQQRAVQDGLGLDFSCVDDVDLARTAIRRATQVRLGSRLHERWPHKGLMEAVWGINMCRFYVYAQLLRLLRGFYSPFRLQLPFSIVFDALARKFSHSMPLQSTSPDDSHSWKGLMPDMKQVCSSENRS